MKSSDYTSKHMFEAPFDDIERSKKQTLRESINALMITFLASGGVIQKCDKKKVITRKTFSWCGVGKKKRPQKPEGVK